MAYDGTLVFDTELDANGFQTGANKLNNLVSGLGIFKLLEKGFQMVANSVDKAMGRIEMCIRDSPYRGRIRTTTTRRKRHTAASARMMLISSSATVYNISRRRTIFTSTRWSARRTL